MKEHGDVQKSDFDAFDAPGAGELGAADLPMAYAPERLPLQQCDGGLTAWPTWHHASTLMGVKRETSAQQKSDIT